MRHVKTLTVSLSALAASGQIIAISIRGGTAIRKAPVPPFWIPSLLNCAYRFASFAAGDHRCIALGGEPSGPPVPIAGNTKKRGSDHNANESGID